MKKVTISLGQILESKLGVNPLTTQAIGEMMEKGLVSLKYYQNKKQSRRGSITLSKIVQWNLGGLHALRRSVVNNLWRVFKTHLWELFTKVVDYITYLIKGGVPRTTTKS